MSDCIFCRIVRGQAPARIVYQDEHVTAFHDLHSRAPVHILIVPNRHIVGVAQVEAEDEPALGRLFTVARRLAEERGITDGYRLVVNNGPQAGQSVFHLHLHLLGGRPFAWPPG
ncbi:MAG TPA: histidine triad nucleotide-binding protein [Anaerolineae bacterium]|nr:histidine triad nucleotide-binding protein [Anaerolineae bacterium]